MKLLMFTKLMPQRSIEELAQVGRLWQLDGFDLCVRKGHPVDPEHPEKLLSAVKILRDNGLDVGMVTGEGSLLRPDQPGTEPLLAAMDAANVRLLKLGYFPFNPDTMDYATELARTRAAILSWGPLARKYNIKICYHTHSNKNIGLNGAAMAHLLQGLDPEYFGAYIDPGHLRVEGEDFAMAAKMLKPWLSIVAVKDMIITREEINGHGKASRHLTPAGQGMVNWTQVFEVLRQFNFQGPVSIHCEYGVPKEEFDAFAQQEAAFFRRFV
jgi:sugar phosphate isomerase/epimerase